MLSEGGGQPGHGQPDHGQPLGQPHGQPGRCRSFLVESSVDLRGSALTYGAAAFLRSAAPVRDACPHGCYLHADPAAADDERLVRAEFFDRGDYQMLVPVRLPW